MQDFNDKLKYLLFQLAERLISPIFSTALPKGMPVVVLMKPLGIGDLIMLSPLITALKAKFNNIRVLSDYPCIFEGLDEVWISPQDLRDITEDTFYVFSSPCWPNFKILLRYPRPYIGNLIRYSTNLNNMNFNEFFDHYFDRTKAIFKTLKISQDSELLYLPLKYEKSVIRGEYLCLSPFCNWITRQTPPDNFISFVERTKSRFSQIIIVGSSNSKEVAYNASFEMRLRKIGYNVQNLTGRTTLKQLVGIIRDCAVYVGNDAGPTHIAMVSAKNVHVFDGCLPANLRMPKNEKLTGQIKSYGKSQFCSAYPCYNGLSEPRCKVLPKYQCMEQSENEYY